MRARQAAEKWEHVYTTQQRQEIARLNQARVDIGKNMNFSLDEKKEIVRLLDLQQAGIEPSMMPKRDKYPEGQGIGQSWTDEEGNIHTREQDGKDVVQVVFEKTRAGRQEIHEQKMELTAAEANQARRIARTTAEVKWSSDTFIDEKSVKKPLTPEMMEERSRKYFPGLWEEDLQKEIREFREYQNKIDEQKAAEAGRRQAELDSRQDELGSRLEQELRGRVQGRKGVAGEPSPVAPSPGAEGVPAEVADAMHYINQIRNTYGDDSQWPPEVQENFNRLSKIIENHFGG